MNTWAIIPVKPLLRAKSRLADVLSAEHRAALAEAMLRQVLSVVGEVGELSGVVISRDPQVLSIARDHRFRTVHESANSDLNPALSRATEVIKVWRGERVLILPADLPFVTADDLRTMLIMGKEARSVVIAPNHLGDGTNAMLVNPPALFPYAYGEGSLQRHSDLARAAGATVRLYHSDTISLDIDVPDDLIPYTERIASGRTNAHLKPVLPDTYHA
jgi:2-phospho-L-lactate guanylyltransferase